MTPRKSRAPLEDYVKEILSDLDTLIAMYPHGIYIAHLTDFYGESINRTVRACQQLHIKHNIPYCQAASKAYYILPVGYTPPTKLHNLSSLQAKLVRFILDTQEQFNTPTVATNYSQLARILGASFGGLRACLKRCEELGYISIHQNSSRGHQQALILSAFEVPRVNPMNSKNPKNPKNTS